MTIDATNPENLARLEELSAAIGGYPDPRRAADEWKQVYKLLQKTNLPSGMVTGVVGMRDAAGLVKLIDRLRAPASESADNTPSAETCQQAMRAFRKRQSLTQLDDESKLGRSPLTKGTNSRFSAIVPPDEWPESVWQELVRQGKLIYIGHGFYELPKTT